MEFWVNTLLPTGGTQDSTKTYVLLLEKNIQDDGSLASLGNKIMFSCPLMGLNAVLLPIQSSITVL